MMLFSIKKFVLLTISVLILSGAVANNQTKAFPTDTIQRFLTAYGKDSLVSLLNERIRISSDFLYINTENVSPFVHVYEFRLVARHFKSDITEASYPPHVFENYFYRLYGNYIGDTSQLFPYMQELNVKNNGNLKVRGCDLKDEMSRIGMATFCDKVGLSPSAVDTLFALRKKVSLQDRIQIYWSLGEIHRSCRSLHPKTEDMISQFYEELSKDFSLKSIYTNKIAFVTGSKTQESYNMYYPLRTLAYSMYVDTGLVRWDSDALMYLLATQNKADGGWSTYYQKDKESQAIPTLYGWWTLYEWRERLLNNVK